MSEVDEELTFEEACEFFEQASQDASMELIITMLGDALNRIRLLERQLEEQEIQKAQKLPPQYIPQKSTPGVGGGIYTPTTPSPYVVFNSNNTNDPNVVTKHAEQQRRGVSTIH